MRLPLFLLFIFLSCTSSQNEFFGKTTPNHGPNELWTNLITEPESLDPGKCGETAGGEVLTNIFARLVQPDPKTLAPTPDIAKSWEVSKDGRRYTFYLRPTLWSDGEPLTAHDFEWSWKRVLNPKTGSKNASLFYVIENAEAFHEGAVFVPKGMGSIPKNPLVERMTTGRTPQGTFLFVSGKSKQERDDARNQILKQFTNSRITDDSFVQVQAVGDLRFQVTLENAVPFFLDLASYYTLSPIPKHLLDRMEKEGKDLSLWTRPENIVSNGAYRLTSWKFRQSMEFEKNDRYWDSHQTQIPSVKGVMVEGANTALNLYRTAEIDYTAKTSLPQEYQPTFSKYKDFVRAPYLANYYYWVNTKAPPLDNIHFRRALSLSLDRESIVKYVTKANQVASSDFVPDGLAGYQGLHSPIYDPEEARKELSRSGVDRSKPLKVVLLYNTLQGHKMIAEAVEQMWKKELGIQIELENQEWKVFLDREVKMDFGLARDAWVGDYPDPFTFLQILMTGDGNNHSNWSNSKYDDLLRRGNQSLDSKERLALFREAEKIVQEAVPVIPIYVWTRSYFVKPYLKGVYPNYQDRHPWKFMSIDSKKVTL